MTISRRAAHKGDNPWKGSVMAQYHVGLKDNPQGRHLYALAAFAGTTLFVWAVLFLFNMSKKGAGPFTFVIAAIIGIGVAVLWNRDLKNLWERDYHRRVKVKEKIDSSGFEFGKIFDSQSLVFMVSEDLSKAMYIDSAIESHCFNASDIKAVSVVVDEQTISNFTTGAGGSLAGAGVGGLMFGGVGAIVGAVAGKKQKAINEIKIKSVQIKLAVAKAGSNLVILDFFKSNEGVSKDDANLQKALAQVDEWWATFTVMSDSKN